MKHFTIEELIYSETALKKRLRNKTTAAAEDNLRRLVETVLDPLREAYGKAVTVTSGYRCKELNKAVGGVGNSQHCFDENTEILTTSGWRTYKTICTSDDVVSYNISEDRVEITPINDIIIREHQGRMMQVQTACIDIVCTDGHRMLVRYPTHKYKRRNTKNITPKGQSYFDSLKTENHKYHIELAQDVFGKRRIYKCAGLYKGSVLSEEDMNLLRFAFAFVCDGYWLEKKPSLAMGFRFRKERKVQHLSNLAKRLGWDFALNLDKNGVYNFYFRRKYADVIYQIVGESKTIPNYLMFLNPSQSLELLECFASYDGSFDRRDNKNRLSMSTTNKANADILQVMSALSGIKCQMQTLPERIYNIKGKTGMAKPAYVLSTCCKDETRAGERDYKWIDYNGIVWCVNNRNTTVITRRNGKIAILGNCLGCAADITGKSKAENRVLMQLVVRLGLPFDQCIDEKGFQWVHVSVAPPQSAARRQLLRYDGRKYTAITTAEI